jgi:F-type H+-transporting ATPase subunit alpha
MATSELILKQLKDKISNYSAHTSVEKVGTVLEVADGITRISGLTDVASMEMLEFPGKIFGVALNLEENLVGAIVLGD